MKAAVHTWYGPPGVVRVVDVPSGLHVGSHYALANIEKANPMTLCSTPSEGARSASAGGCWNRVGAYLSTDLGPRGENPFLALVTPLLPGKSVLFGFPRHDQAMMNDFKDLMESGLLRPVTERSYPLTEIIEAYQYVETGQKIGNVVITVEQGD